MLDGEGERSRWASGTPSEFELFDLLPACIGDRFGLLMLRELPPVQSLFKAAGLPAVELLPAVPTLVAASNAPLSPPVYVFVCGFGFTGGLEKAREAPRRAASRTLCCVSPVDCGARPWLRAELIESPSD